MERIRTALDLRLWLSRLFVSGCKLARDVARTIWLLPLLVGRNRRGDIEMPTIPRPLTVLLSDDERNTRDIWCPVFELEGMVAISAADGNESMGGLKSEVQHLSRIRCCNARQNYFIPAPST